MSLLLLLFLVVAVVPAMEAASGEYGDVVPRLVVAVHANQCRPFQRERRLTNCEISALYNVTSGLDQTSSASVSGADDVEKSSKDPQDSVCDFDMFLAETIGFVFCHLPSSSD